MDQYRDIAEDYKESKGLPFRKHVEEYSIFRMLGDVSGKTVVDMACGDGFYSRKLAAAGAEVVGVDLSPEMVKLAEDDERRRPLGIRYVNGDAANLEGIDSGKADIVLAAYLLNYADTEEKLTGFCRSAHRLLKPDGGMVGVNDNIRDIPGEKVSFAPYGFEKGHAHPLREGDPIVYRIEGRDGEPFEFRNFYLKPETYQRSFEMAGFRSFRWREVEIDPLRKDDRFWKTFMSHPPIIGFIARK